MIHACSPTRISQSWVLHALLCRHRGDLKTWRPFGAKLRRVRSDYFARDIGLVEKRMPG